MRQWVIAQHRSSIDPNVWPQRQLSMSMQITFFLVCKSHYIRLFDKGIVYYAISYIPSRHLQKIKSWSIILYVCYVSLWISTKDEEQDPPSLYWISYMHIGVPFKQCYIAMPVKCSTKPLSELLTSNYIGRVTLAQDT